MIARLAEAEARAAALQSKIDRQRADIAKKDDQIRQLKEDKAMLLRDLKRLQSEAHGG
jgi:multidrug resistance efflux pump